MCNLRILFKLQQISGGLVNFLWKGYSATDENDNDNDGMIAIKIFGEGGDHILDREKEKILMEALNEQGICPTLHAV